MYKRQLAIGAGLLAAGTGLSALAIGFTALATAGAAGATAIVAALTVIVTGIYPTQNSREIALKAFSLFKQTYKWHTPVRAVTVRAICLLYTSFESCDRRACYRGRGCRYHSGSVNR